MFSNATILVGILALVIGGFVGHYLGHQHQHKSHNDHSMMDMDSEMSEMNTMSVAMDEMANMERRQIEIAVGDPVPTLAMTVTPDTMDGFNIALITENFTFTPAETGAPAVPNTGHAHVYINGVKFSRVYSNWMHLPAAALETGENEIKVTLNANTHAEWATEAGAIVAVTTITQ